jgi:hypothetical protein
MRCRVCGIDAEIYVVNEEEECALIVDDSYVCDGCQEVIDRAELQMEVGMFETLQTLEQAIEALKNGYAVPNVMAAKAAVSRIISSAMAEDGVDVWDLSRVWGWLVRHGLKVERMTSHPYRSVTVPTVWIKGADGSPYVLELM